MLQLITLLTGGKSVITVNSLDIQEPNYKAQITNDSFRRRNSGSGRNSLALALSGLKGFQEGSSSYAGRDGAWYCPPEMPCALFG